MEATAIIFPKKNPEWRNSTQKKPARATTVHSNCHSPKFETVDSIPANKEIPSNKQGPTSAKSPPYHCTITERPNCTHFSPHHSGELGLQTEIDEHSSVYSTTPGHNLCFFTGKRYQRSPPYRYRSFNSTSTEDGSNREGSYFGKTNK
jgi:hypothetical protein